MKRWQEIIGKSSLRHLDISNNPLHDQGVSLLIQGLLEGPVISEADAKRDPSRGPAWSRRPPKLRTLILKSVCMADETGVYLTQLIT